MKGCRELNVFSAQIASELEPVFDGPIRIGIPLRARRQLLQCAGQYPHLHELRFECGDTGSLTAHTRVHAPPSAALSRIASTMRLARKPSSKVAAIGGSAGYGGPAAVHAEISPIASRKREAH